MRIVLGHLDYEMRAINTLAARCGVPVTFAMAGGHPVLPSNAYQADAPEPEPGDIWVECRPEGMNRTSLETFSTTVVDHHHPGDAGYGVPPEEAVRASSLGQVAALLGMTLLGMELSPVDTLFAAMDHAEGAAAAGVVPGVSAKAVATVLWTQEPVPGVPGATYIVPVMLREALLEEVRKLPLIDGIRDGRMANLPRAAYLLGGKPYITTVLEPDLRPDATPGQMRLKVVLGGYVRPSDVATFRALAERKGWNGFYPPGSDEAVAVRGFAEAYVSV